jgi:hypothetical protein
VAVAVPVAAVAAAAAVETAVGEVATEGVAGHQKQNHWHGMRQQ